MPATPDLESVGLDPARWNYVQNFARKLCDNDDLPAVGIVAGTADATTDALLVGRQQVDSAEPVRDDAIFLVASITKPIVTTAALMLIERGQLLLSDKVRHYIPEFGNNGKNGIAIRHLVTHTSGLPDMLPDNLKLRAAHAPFETFLEEIYQLTPGFSPGRGVSYQSMGLATLAEVIRRVAGMPCREFLARELFEPLGMTSTSLGAPDAWFEGAEPMRDRIAEIRRPPTQPNATDWDWNSRYWLSFGAPWGGVLTTPGDLAKLAQMMLNGGRHGDRQILSPATVAAATRNQLAQMREVPEIDRQTRPWGLGWKLNWTARSENFGDLLGPQVYGHWGSTGTVLWIDPAARRFAVVLTTQPQEPRGVYCARLSNTIAAAFNRPASPQ